jgi:hypothetical protein
MLLWFDTLIGLVVILLSVSLIVMILTQALASLLNLRGTKLKRGLQVLFENSNGKLVEYAEDISHKILSHPLISDKGNGGLSSTIRNAELINILNVLAETKNDWAIHLKDELAEVESHINIWFDKTMDRVSQGYMNNTRIFTVVFSLIIAFSFHLNFFHAFKQISQNAELRGSLVVHSNSLLKMDEEARLAKISGKDEVEKLKQLLAQATTLKTELDNTGFSLIPDDYKNLNYSPLSQDFWGMLMMAALMSLGAPFWFNALKTMSSLRPVLANKEAEERN